MGLACVQYNACVQHKSKRKSNIQLFICVLGLIFDPEQLSSKLPLLMLSLSTFNSKCFTVFFFSISSCKEYLISFRHSYLVYFPIISNQTLYFDYKYSCEDVMRVRWCNSVHCSHFEVLVDSEFLVRVGEFGCCVSIEWPVATLLSCQNKPRCSLTLQLSFLQISWLFAFNLRAT